MFTLLVWLFKKNPCCFFYKLYNFEFHFVDFIVVVYARKDTNFKRNSQLFQDKEYCSLLFMTARIQILKEIHNNRGSIPFITTVVYDCKGTNF